MMYIGFHHWRKFAILAIFLTARISAETQLDKLWLHEDFEDHPLGTELNDVPKFGAAGNGSVVDTVPQQLHSSKSGRTWIAKGDDGWSRWGYSLGMFPEGVSKGSVIWWRTALYFPKGFPLRGDHGSLKTWRVGRVKLTDGSSKGYIDIQTMASHNWRSIVEHTWGENGYDPAWVHFDDGPVEYDKWQVWEVQVVLDDVPVDDGGGAMIRMWRDGDLFAEIYDRATLSKGLNMQEVNRLLMWTYFNGGAPSTVEHFFDDVTVAIKSPTRDDSKYLSHDAEGNLYIGLIGEDNGGPVDPPEPPDCPECPEDSTTEVHMHTGKTHVLVNEERVLISTDLPIIVGDDP